MKDETTFVSWVAFMSLEYILYPTLIEQYLLLSSHFDKISFDDYYPASNV